jgi:hypothetical protein
MSNVNLIVVPIGDTRLNDDQIVGSVVERGGKTYRWVKNAQTTTVAADDAVAYHEPSTNGLTQVKTPVTANIALPAGVVVAAIAAGSFGWVQTKGIANAHCKTVKGKAVVRGAFGQLNNGEDVWHFPSTTADKAAAVSGRLGYASAIKPHTATTNVSSVDTLVYLNCV